ncbi:hypothetical protein DEJ12_15790 [Curtobacterium sp. MCLR17_059]|nr:hypothetical protein DEJ12_15790 [Curtobacterium sp. MCLR17_059]PZF53251.1 hypothetical protein DEJ10_06450 [Curtobacterium sp. MCLR17_057]
MDGREARVAPVSAAARRCFRAVATWCSWARTAADPPAATRPATPTSQSDGAATKTTRAMTTPSVPNRVAPSRDRRMRIAVRAGTADARSSTGACSARRRVISRCRAASWARTMAVRLASSDRATRCAWARDFAFISMRTSSGSSAVCARIRRVCCSRMAFRSVARYWRRAAHDGIR